MKHDGLPRHARDEHSIKRWKQKRERKNDAACDSHRVELVRVFDRGCVHLQKRVFFECFPYVCPEPVLVK
eukprot:COSAG06_NODE_2362_length_7003_cov_15.069815_12_plen_70_part_00